MTIAVGMLCDGGVVFGADVDETVGDMRRRVHKIPTKIEGQRALITGACENGHLMDTAVERIFDGLTPEKAQTTKSTGAFLQEIMLGLYRDEFPTYPDQNSTRMRLLVATKPQEENKAAAWSIDCSSVHRMKPMEIVGCGDLVQFVGDHLYTPYMALESGKVAIVQVLSAAKKIVQYVGGDSYVHVLRDDEGIERKNFCFSPDEEDLYEFFFTLGRGLLLVSCAGNT
ncbi:MAG: hypothetical protein LAN70_00865 [Acidobacteriia bacterium]|nr:hypothetical protein [Terriglobia bacterium]